MAVSAVSIPLSAPWPLPGRSTTRLAEGELHSLAVAVVSDTVHVDDQQLVERCRRGDGEAWEAVVRQHSRRVYNLCFRFTSNAGDAEDLSQEVFVRVYRNLHGYRPEQGALGTWISTITRNLLVDHYRRTRQQRLTDSLDAPRPGAEGGPAMEVADPARPPEHSVWNREISEQVQRALARLSPELREAVVLRDLQEMDYKEIASVLSLPVGTVKSRINRGRIELARLLKRRLGEAGGLA